MIGSIVRTKLPTTGINYYGKHIRHDPNSPVAANGVADGDRLNFVFKVMTFKIDNSPNWYEYLLVALAFFSISALSLQAILIFIPVTLLIYLFLYSKNAGIILGETSLEIHFKAGFFTYSKFSRHFNKITIDQDTIRFYNDDEMAFLLDVGLSYDDDDKVHSISLRSDKKDISLGNKKNCLTVFSVIKQFYLNNTPDN